MVYEDFAVTTKHPSEELTHIAPCHFDNRILRLERGLYVIREQTHHNANDNRAQKNEYLAEVFKK